MNLSARDQCFACASHKSRLIWRNDERSLKACVGCGAEWVEGVSSYEQAYRYGHVSRGAEQYLKGRAARFARYLRKMQPMPGRLLDVGCGTGDFIALAAGAGWDPVGIELSDEAARIARSRSGLPALAGDLIADDLFPSRSFDIVTLWGVLEHVPDPRGLLLACRRLVRPGGLLLLETPNSRAIFRIVSRLLLNASGRHFDRPFVETLGAGHVVWYSSDALRAAAQQLDTQVVEIRGSRNSSQFLIGRWDGMPLGKRLVFQAATLALNFAAMPSAHPNQLMASLRARGYLN